MSSMLLSEKQTNTLKFVPDLVYFEPAALEYEKGQNIYKWAQEHHLPIQMTTSHNRIKNFPGENDLIKYKNAKRTLAVGIRKTTCTSDPVGLEHITGSLRELIEWMGREPYGRLRFVTKYHHVDSLLDAKHNRHTRFRFSINSDYVIRNFEPNGSRPPAKLPPPVIRSALSSLRSFGMKAGRMDTTNC